uniref:Uncharacterized protein n=1 Tax=Plectus sambesii TaxID=2011161 RepID=A0A914X183_9BILA
MVERRVHRRIDRCPASITDRCPASIIDRCPLLLPLVARRSNSHPSPPHPPIFAHRNRLTIIEAAASDNGRRSTTTLDSVRWSPRSASVACSIVAIPR